MLPPEIAMTWPLPCVVATRARLADKRADHHTHSGANGAMMSSEAYYLIFEVDTGSTMEFSVNGVIYREAAGNDWGTLTFQGTRFLRFESAGMILA